MLKLDHVGVVVKNVEESVKFYIEAFGWEKLGGREDERVKIVYLGAGNQVIEILKYFNEEFERVRGIVDHLAFTVEDMGKEVERLKSLGAKPLFEAPRDLVDKVIMFFEGPSGERLELVAYK